MFGFIKKVFVVAMSFLSRNALKGVSINIQECKAGPEVNKCSGIYRYMQIYGIYADLFTVFL